ncbi:hypothetical protein BDN72DRAFT_594888 [Pluteus cervinus]|uniref:Uncharacterized protein n=1 Tax=Pluteus cervinus TaxID=181527 RepID=A0ACD3AV65_9AGAR|nr:hypothetical protein BDN72DRAFT_594888 [Pluteus cervinus]
MPHGPNQKFGQTLRRKRTSVPAIMSTPLSLCGSFRVLCITSIIIAGSLPLPSFEQMDEISATSTRVLPRPRPLSLRVFASGKLPHRVPSPYIAPQPHHLPVFPVYLWTCLLDHFFVQVQSIQRHGKYKGLATFVQ